MGEGLAKEITEFIVRYVDSIELLEVLGLLHGEPERSWTIDELDAVIRSTATSIESRLRRLIDLHFVTSTTQQSFRYAPPDERTLSLADALVLAYRTRRVEVTELIYTKPMKEIVSFSSAFKLRGGSKKDG